MVEKATLEYFQENVGDVEIALKNRNVRKSKAGLII